jgi:hypothetical protein
MTPITQVPAATTTSGISIALIVLMWVAWVGVLLVADLMAFMMFAFADSPGAGKAAQAMIVPIFGWFLVTFVAGIVLLIFRGWWQVPLAFVLAVSPPFMVFAGYNLLMGKSTAMPATPAVQMQTPPGGFTPTLTSTPTSIPTYKPNFTMPKQPDWRAATRPTTKPTQDER